MTVIDFNDVRYSVARWPGIAFYLTGYATTPEPIMVLTTVNDDGEYDPDGQEVEIESGEYDQVEDREHVIAIMVGDDREHTVDVDDLTVIADDDYCGGCGQIGCTADGR